MHDDLQMMRQLEMEKCLSDGQFPCRWVPDMGYGFGFPLFNYYPPLPYLVGELIRFLGFSFMETVKINFALSLILSGFSMFFLAKEFFGKLGGIVSAIFYLWAPYRAVDIFVRGAMNESWSFVFFPLVFLFSYKIITDQKNKKGTYLIYLALSFSGLLLSHNIMVMIFTPFFILWLILWFFIKRSWHIIPNLVSSAILSFGLAAFFTFPAFFEQDLVQIRSLTEDYYDFRGHFVSLNQLFISRFWGYEGSYFGSDNDGMSFQIGHLHWIFSLFLAFLTGFKLFVLLIKYSKKFFSSLKKHPLFLTLLFFLFMGSFSAFMTHSKSIFIWEIFSPLRFVQFPWRFLTLVVFAFSFLAGSIFLFFGKLKQKFGFLAKFIFTSFEIFTFFLIAILLVYLNWTFFRPKNAKLGLISDKEKFSGVSWQLQQGGGVLDYLPNSVKVAPHAASGGLVDVLDGEANISKAEQGTYWVKFEADVLSNESVIRINIFDFPNWRFWANGKEIETFIPDYEEKGRIHVRVKNGRSLIYGQLFNTQIRTYANLFSFFSWTLLIGYLVFFKSLKRKFNLHAKNLQENNC